MATSSWRGGFPGLPMRPRARNAGPGHHAGPQEQGPGRHKTLPFAPFVPAEGKGTREEDEEDEDEDEVSTSGDEDEDKEEDLELLRARIQAVVRQMPDLLAKLKGDAPGGVAPRPSQR